VGTEDEKLIGIDLDFMQKSWFINDIGTVTWTANMALRNHDRHERLQLIEQFKTWFLEAYKWPTTEEELRQGCHWRNQFMAKAIKQGHDSLPPTSPYFYSSGLYLEMYNHGLIPDC